MTNISSATHVPGYVERPYEQVCDLLDAWRDQPLPNGPSETFAIGELTRVSRWSAHAPILQPRNVELGATTELRVLPIHTGRDALTELLLVAGDSSESEHTARVEELSSLLAALVRLLDRAA